METQASIQDRVPPGQRLTDGFPVLHHGDVPVYRDLSQWDLKIFGQVEEQVILSTRNS